MTDEAREAREAAFKKYREGFKTPQSERVDFNTAFDAGVVEGIRMAREAVGKVPVTQSRQEALAQIALLTHEVTGMLGTVTARGDET